MLDAAVAKLKELKGEEVDLKTWMHIIAVECLGAVVLGWSPGYIKAGSDGGTSTQGYLGWKRKSVFGLFPAITKLGFLEGPWNTGLGEKVGKGITRWWSNAWGVTFATPKNFKPFFTPVYQRISKRINAALKGEVVDPRAKASKKNKAAKAKEGERRKDLLEDLINLHKFKPHLFTETYLRRMATTNFGAGHETLCSALTACLAMIGSHPAVQDRVAQEVGPHLKETGTVPFDATAKELKYTLAAIKEAQRLHPVIAMSLSRTVPRTMTKEGAGGGGTVINGYWIPSGTTVGCNPVALHRNREIFGEDAGRYNPDRWLPGGGRAVSIAASGSKADADSDLKPISDLTTTPDTGSNPASNHSTSNLEEDDADRKRLREMLHLNLTYGGAPRTCPGRHLAELIVWKVVPRLIAEFKVEVTRMPEDEEGERFFMSMLTGVGVRFLERGQESE